MALPEEEAITTAIKGICLKHRIKKIFSKINLEGGIGETYLGNFDELTYYFDSIYETDFVIFYEVANCKAKEVYFESQFFIQIDMLDKCDLYFYEETKDFNGFKIEI